MLQSPNCSQAGQRRAGDGPPGLPQRIGDLGLWKKRGNQGPSPLSAHRQSRSLPSIETTYLTNCTPLCRLEDEQTTEGDAPSPGRIRPSGHGCCRLITGARN
uniref:Uncharacterized protein n=1 Tax=Plectus sambesii TaxID=2011161 RepID=A0A914X415_9BILA